MGVLRKAREKLSSRYDLVTLSGALGYFWFSYFCTRLAIRYTTVADGSVLPAGLAWIGPDNSIILWGILWGIGAVLGMAGAVFLLWNKYKLFFISATYLVSMHFVWATVYLIGWMFYDDKLGWLNSGTYYGPIGLLIGFIIGAVRAQGKRVTGGSVDKKELR